MNRKRIFVYGSLRKGEYNYREEMGEPICTGHIHKAQLYSLGAFPAIVASDDEADTVTGEVYDLADKQFASIDRMEVGAGYELRPVLVWWKEIDRNFNGDGNPLEAEAYFYPAVQDWFGPRIDNGDWSTR